MYINVYKYISLYLRVPPLLLQWRQSFSIFGKILVLAYHIDTSIKKVLKRWIYKNR